MATKKVMCFLMSAHRTIPGRGSSEALENSQQPGGGKPHIKTINDCVQELLGEIGLFTLKFSLIFMATRVNIRKEMRSSGRRQPNLRLQARFHSPPRQML